MNAIVSGIRVFFIQKQCVAGPSKTNSIPSFGPSAGRNIRPLARVPGVSAISARIRCMPAWTCIVGSGGWPVSVSSRAAGSTCVAFCARASAGMPASRPRPSAVATAAAAVAASVAGTMAAVASATG